MLRIVYGTLVFVLLVSCGGLSNELMVQDEKALKMAIKTAKPGDVITMADGVWNDIRIQFEAYGTDSNPITLRAQTPGKVTIEGQSSLELAGEYLIVDGLYFRNGYTPSNSVIDFRMDKTRIANHSSVINCVIEDFSQLNRYTPDHWVELWGRYNKLDHCSIQGKSNQGPTVRVFLKGNEHIRNYHQITNNYFGPRPRKGGPRAETMQIGDSGTSMTPSYVTVADNLFDRCNGEVEVISSKSNFNEFRNNVFYQCEGSLVMRHGNYCIIDGNYFIGDENSEFNGGIRVINTGHWVTNNYFYKIRGAEFRSPLAIMNGIPKSPLNRYNQVTDVVVAYNTWIDCKSPWQFSVGANTAMKDVLPASEIRSARPTRTILANNIIYNQTNDDTPFKTYDKVDGIDFHNNLIHNPGMDKTPYNGIQAVDLVLKKFSDWLFIPVVNQEANIASVYSGFDFETIKYDIRGNSRITTNSIGAVIPGRRSPKSKIDASTYGAKWFEEKSPVESPNVSYEPDGPPLVDLISQARSGSIIQLPFGLIELDASIIVDKDITLRGMDPDAKTELYYSGPKASPLFRMSPRGKLVMDNLILRGDDTQYAFASRETDTSPGYNLMIGNSEIQNFDYVLKTYRGAFADTISISNSTIWNCMNGIELAAEVDDKGDYNAEFLTIQNCSFDNVHKNVIHYYRGGYDESTIGGNLLVENTNFTNCGRDDDDKILLKTRGIINVNIKNNTFTNNQVKLVALLWGAKNNQHSNNKFSRSGNIRVEEQLKLKLMY